MRAVTPRRIVFRCMVAAEELTSELVGVYLKYRDWVDGEKITLDTGGRRSINTSWTVSSDFKEWSWLRTLCNGNSRGSRSQS